jgi:MYXO-CTERM domain-containing protein
MKPQTLLPVLLFAGFAASAEAAVYAGNGRAGFGGPVGSGSLSVTDDGVNLSFTFTRGSGNFNDFLVIYFDSTTGGASSLPASGEIGSPFSGRRAIVNEYGSGVVFGGGFASDFAFALKANGSASNHLFSTASGANANTLGFVSTAAVTNFGNAAAATYSWSISLASLGLNAGDSVDFVTTYLNPNDGGGADASFRSNEAFVTDLGATNPGFGGVTFASFQTYTTVPEPAAALLGSLGLLALLRRRK